MAIGNFTLTGTYLNPNGAPDSGKVKIESIPSIVVDSGGNHVFTSPLYLALNAAGSFSTTLPSDSSSGSSTAIGYRVTKQRIMRLDSTPVTFFAPAIGSSLDMASVTSQAVVPVVVGGATLSDLALKADKVNLPLNVKDYGAAGNGTTDDSTAVQAALTAATPGATIYIPKGPFKVTTPLTLSVANVTLTGPGELRFTAGIAAADALRITGDGVRVDGLKITNPNLLKSDTGTNANVGIRIKANKVTVTGNTLDSFQHAIIVDATGEYDGAIISNNHVLNVLGSGAGPSDSTSLLGEDRGDGITSWGRNTTITGNIVECKPGDDARIGIHVEGFAVGHSGTGQSPLADMFATISGNLVTGQFRRGIACEDVAGTTITGNSVEGSTWWGISVSGPGAIGCVVTGNHVLWTRTSTDNQGGHYSPTRTPYQVLYGAQGTIMSGNSVRLTATSAANAALCVLGDTTRRPSDVKVTNNTVLIDSGAAVTNGFLHSGFSTGVEVRGNRFFGATSATGIDGGTATRCDIEENYLQRGAKAAANIKGIVAGNMAAGTVSRNIINNYDVGIERFGATSGVVTHNDLGNCTTGIDCGSASNVQVVGNNLQACTGTKYGGTAHSTSGMVVRQNHGYISEARGTGTILDTTSSIAVTHGLALTPITVTVTPGGNETLWVSARTSTTFTVTRTGTTGARTFDWTAEL